MAKMNVSKSKTIRLIEWEQAKPLKLATLKSVKMYPDTFQIFEWIIRQALIVEGFKMGFEELTPEIRAHHFAKPSEYVKSILNEISKHERVRERRFQAAIRLYDYHSSEEDPKQWIIDDLLKEVGATDGATFAKFLTIERPEKLLSYGFERFHFPLLPTLLKIKAELKNCGITQNRGITKSQERLLRRKMGNVSRFLVKNGDGSWKLDFSNSPLIKRLIFYSAAAYSNFEDGPYQLNKFISHKIRFHFRGDEGVNSVLPQSLSSEVIRERIKGDKGGRYMSQCETLLRDSGLVDDDLYSYLEDNSALLKTGMTPYLDPLVL